MTTEEYLNSIQTYEKRIEIKTMELCRLKTMSNNVRKSNLDERVQNNTQSKDSVGDAVAKIIDLEKNVDSVVDDFIRKRNEIIKKLDGIKNIQYYQVLSLKYINNKTYKEIAELLGCSIMQINRIRQKAILEFEKMYGNDYIDIEC